MVDKEKFGEGNSWATLTIAPRIILQLTILERRHYYIDSSGAQVEKFYTGKATDLSIMKRWLWELLQEVSPLLRGKDDLRNNVTKGLNSDTINDVTLAFEELSNFLYDKGLTKWDTKGGYDKTRAEEENKHEGI